MARLIRNSARCRRCKDEVESRHRHELVSCECGAIAVDGGLAYMRRIGEPDAFEDTSMWDVKENEVDDTHPTRDGGE